VTLQWNRYPAAKSQWLSLKACRDDKAARKNKLDIGHWSNLISIKDNLPGSVKIGAVTIPVTSFLLRRFCLVAFLVLATPYLPASQ
jgi:phosphoribosyl-dephospho-CoA transferase